MSWKTQKDALEQDGFHVRIETPEPGNWRATLEYYKEPTYYIDEARNSHPASARGNNRAAAISELFQMAARFELWFPIILGAKRFDFDGQKYHRLNPD